MSAESDTKSSLTPSSASTCTSVNSQHDHKNDTIDTRIHSNTVESAAVTVTVAAIQFAAHADSDNKNPALNSLKAEQLIREAAGQGAQIILLQELFNTTYFCADQNCANFDLARTANVDTNPVLKHFAEIAAELEVVLPISFFEKCGQNYFNSIMVLDADGSSLGIYRKSHIPDGPGYQEKFYFTPGDTGFRVFRTRFADIACLVCWDQWFPEAARCVALKGAQLIFFPTAIGSEPQEPDLDSHDHWQTVIRGHAAANMIPIIVSNRIGVESHSTFYGGSFIADVTGKVVQKANQDKETVLLHSFNLLEHAKLRRSWGIFRDRRPDLYSTIATLDGRSSVRGDAIVAAENKHTVSLSSFSKELTAPASDGFHMPAEWEAHSCCWMAWPTRLDTWRDGAVPAQQTFAKVANAIATFEPVKVLFSGTPCEYQRVRTMLCSRVKLVEMTTDDAWLRDTGPTFVIRPTDRKVRGIDWKFNAWGGPTDGCYWPCEYDQLVPTKILEMIDIGRYKCAHVLEGGSIHVDGQGTCITTEECLLHENRNPGMTRIEIECMLKRFLGVKKVIWLPFGLANDLDTNGHVDNITAFVRPAHVVLAWTDDEKDDQFARSKAALDVLQNTTDACGRRIQVHKLHIPDALYYTEQEVKELSDQNTAASDSTTSDTSDLHGIDGEDTTSPIVVGQRLAASYVNFYLAGQHRQCHTPPAATGTHHHGGVIVPSFNDAVHDQAAVDLLQSLFPHRVIIPIPAREIVLGGGGIHCITQQQPY
jgi:agmatine deiminase